MQGIYIHNRRPKTKKALKETVKAINEESSSPEGAKLYGETHTCTAECVSLEATSWFGNEYQGSLDRAPRNITFYLVGPDPHTNRKWYANLSWKEGKGWVVS